MILPDAYPSRVRGLNCIPRSKRLTKMLLTLERPIDIGLHNRMLYDAVQLISRDDWDPANDATSWCFTDVNKINLPQMPRQEVGEDLLQKLEAKIAEAKRETCQSFEAFRQKAVCRLNSITEFVDWFYRYLPYAALDLHWDHALDAKIDERINWMLEQSPEPLEPETLYALDNYARKFICDWNIPVFKSQRKH